MTQLENQERACADGCQAVAVRVRARARPRFSVWSRLGTRQRDGLQNWACAYFGLLQAEPPSENYQFCSCAVRTSASGAVLCGRGRGNWANQPWQNDIEAKNENIFKYIVRFVYNRCVIASPGVKWR